MKQPTNLLVYQYVRSRKGHDIVTEKFTKALSSFGKSIKLDIQDAWKAITRVVVAPRSQMVLIMLNIISVSRKTFEKYTKFRVQIDESNEAACWDLFYRKP